MKFATHIAAWPVVPTIGGTTCVRSIQKVNPDGSLTFSCAIENGWVLRIAKGVDLLQNLEQTFAGIHAEIGSPQLGFHTYGEQFRGVHVNQTLVGTAFGTNAVETNDV